MTVACDLRVISLFAGIGGIDLALERAGMTTVVQVEIDDAARGVLAAHWPHVARFPDVREVTPDECVAAGFVPGRGVIAAGFPCQDLSVAGRRAGLGGARSGLFWEIVRLADALRPEWLVLENVPGLLSANDGRDMGTVLGAVGDLGYGYAYRVLDAQFFGVPQRRRRVFIVGRLGDAAGPVQVLLEPDGSGRNSASRRAAGAHVAALTANGVGAGGRPDDNAAQAGHLITALTTRAGATYDDHQTTQLVPTLEAGTNHTGGTRPPGTTVDTAESLIAFDAAQITSPDNRVNPRAGDPSMPLAATGQPHIAYALRSDPGGTGQGHNTTYIPMVSGTLGGKDGDSRTTDLDGHGAYVPVSLAVAGDFSSSEEVAQAVRAAHGQPGVIAFDWQTDGSDRTRPNLSTERTSALGTSNRDALATATAVRRLTPTECERLQGFPDGWTAISKGKVQTDSPRYRQLGNTVAVPVLEWIGRRIAAVEQARAEREQGAA